MFFFFIDGQLVNVNVQPKHPVMETEARSGYTVPNPTMPKLNWTVLLVGKAAYMHRGTCTRTPNHKREGLTWKLYKKSIMKKLNILQFLNITEFVFLLNTTNEHLIAFYNIHCNLENNSIIWKKNNARDTTHKWPLSSKCILHPIKALNWLKNPHWQSHNSTAEIIDF